MNETLNFKNEIENKEELKYLNSGNQTIITPKVLEIANSINSNSKSFENRIESIFDFIKTISYKTENKMDVFRKRTADEIISSGFKVGCSDEALVFITISRAMKIPTKYIETINLDFLERDKNEQGSYSGHVYSSIFKKDENKWIFVDQTKGKIDVNISNDKRVIFAEGFDSWDIGINNFEDLKKDFNKFRETFNNKNQ